MVETRDSSKKSEEGTAGEEINKDKSTKGYEFDKLSSEINSINTTLQNMIKSFDIRTSLMNENVKKSCDAVRTELNDNLNKQQNATNQPMNVINKHIASIKGSITNNNTNDNKTNDVVKRLDKLDDKIEIMSKSQHSEVDNSL